MSILRIGILQTDSVLEKFQPKFGDYPLMFERVLQSSARLPDAAEIRVECINYPVQQSMPATLDCDAYLITGSRDSVYDDAPWIIELVSFVERAMAAGKKIIGICFGHQLMAHFFGGRVAPAEGGWVVGVHTSDIARHHNWMGEVGRPQFSLLSSHKDQVVELPEAAEVFATNGFCPIAGFTMSDQVITVQGHPEFSKPYAQGLLDHRRALLGEAVYQQGMDSMSKATDELLVSRWLLQFVTGQESTRS